MAALIGTLLKADNVLKACLSAESASEHVQHGTSPTDDLDSFIFDQLARDSSFAVAASLSCKIYHPATKSTSASSSNGPEEPAAHKCLENHG